MQPINKNPTALFLSDVDGSLLTPDRRLTTKALDARMALKKQGIAFTIVSGRPPKGMRDLIAELQIDLPIAAFNGGVIIRPDLSVIEEHPLDPSTAASVLEALESMGIEAYLYRGTEWFVKDANAPHVHNELTTVGFDPTVVREFDPAAGAAKIVAVSDDSKLLSRCETFISKTFSERVSSHLSQPYYLDITHPKANKGEVVRTLSRLLSIPTPHFATLGDMPNDILMFKESGLSIAMANATPEVKRAANYVTRRNDQDGFAYAVESIILSTAFAKKGGWDYMKRNANALWNGNLKEGAGSLSTESGALKDIPYSFRTRFESQLGANPEELIAAAHAGCFSMALANELEASKLAPTKIETRASVDLELVEGKWSVQKIDLFLKASLRDLPEVPFLAAASRAKANCPISRLLNARIFLHTELQDVPSSETEAEIVIYTSTYCQVCGKAKLLLESQAIRYREIDLDVEPPEATAALVKKTGLKSVPQIFVGEHFIGSYDDLVQLDLDHGLTKLLQSKCSPKPIAKAG